ncbi:putative repeat protein (TIGR02543 family) [Lachnospiraceae bacterium PM6-15]|uniref:InlB B-repeat-containing protein n=1 Tax=Ohessyouella blattaphilus TaxID=2949333 RepID=UPI003E180AFB
MKKTNTRKSIIAWILAIVVIAGMLSTAVDSRAEVWDPGIYISIETGGNSIPIVQYNQIMPGVEGVSYSLETHTLTIDNCNASSIYVNYAPYDFKIEIEGECSFITMDIQGKGCTLTGDGSLNMSNTLGGLILRSHEVGGRADLIIDGPVVKLSGPNLTIGGTVAAGSGLCYGQLYISSGALEINSELAYAGVEIFVNSTKAIGLAPIIFSGGSQVVIKEGDTAEALAEVPALTNMNTSASEEDVFYSKKHISILVDDKEPLEENEYRLSFNGNGGNVDQKYKTVTYGAEYGELPIPTRTGHQFSGWYTSRTGGTEVVSTDIVSLEADIKLYAQWTTMDYTLSFDANGGTVDPTSKMVTYGQPYGELPIPIREGYNFVGWYTSNDESDPNYYFTYVSSANNFTFGADQTIYARWFEDWGFHILVYEDSEAGGVFTPIVKRGTSTDVNISGLTFDETSQTLTMNNYQGESIVVNGAPENFSIQIDGNNDVNSIRVEDGFCTLTGQGTLTSSDVGFALFSSMPEDWYNLTIDGPTLCFTEGASLCIGAVGNYANFGQLFFNSGSLEVNNTRWNTGVTIVSDRTKESELEPIVFPEEANVLLKEAEGEEPLSEVAALTNCRNTYYEDAVENIFVGKSHISIQVDNSGIPKAEEYTVTFNSNGGEVSLSDKKVVQGSTYGELPIPTRTGYTFNGWFTSKTGDKQVLPTTMVELTQNQNLYAQWTAKKHTITFNANGGTVDTNSKKVTYGKGYGALPTPTKSGYTFKGWFTSKTGDKQVLSTTKVEIVKNQNLYAQWLPKYTVTFNANSGVVSPTSKEVAKGLMYGELPVPVKAGYYFKGWFTSKTGDKQVLPTTVVEISKNQNLYAQWLPGYTVTFNANGGNVSSANKIVAKGLNYGSLPTPTKDGYYFKGWFTSKTGDKQVMSTTVVEISKNQNLYAQWLPGYTVTFNANGGVVSLNSKIVGKGLTYETLPVPTRNGYTFKGWFTSKTGTRQVLESTKVEITKNQNLYAQWEKE